MKMTILKQPAVTEEVEVKLPCFRKRYDNYGYIYEGGHISLNLCINSAYKTTASGSEFFDGKSLESTKEEFRSALAKIQDAITVIENMI